MSWEPNIPAALLLLALVTGMYGGEIREYLFTRRFFSPEYRRIQKIGRALRSARDEQMRILLSLDSLGHNEQRQVHAGRRGTE